MIRLLAAAGISLALAARLGAAEAVIISEFMASNSRTLADEDGNYEDWIEIYNGGASTINLEGWHLTDDRADLTQWTFPATNLGPNRFLVVFASNKDRRVPGAPLHTSFKLSAGGEYLALVRPDGTNIATEFAPTFPPQAEDISYGIPVTATPVSLLGRGSPGKFLVPPNGALGTNWILPAFNASAWSNVVVPVGFDVSNSFVLVPLTDSIADWSSDGTQGFRGWSYGYYNRSADAVPGYQPGDFTAFPRDPAQPYGAANYWNGGAWRWPSATAPWDTIGQTDVHPNGVNNGDEHWVIRRWVCTTNGSLQAAWRLYKTNPNGTGVTGKVLHNGVEKDTATIAGTDTAGVTRAVNLTNVQAGDVIDLALTPIGLGGATDDGADGSYDSLAVSAMAYLTNLVISNVGGWMWKSNSSAYLRVPFGVTNRADLDRLVLRLQYDDGFAVCLNGVEVARSNAPAGLTWNAAATATRSPAQTTVVEEFDLTAYLDFVSLGTNLLAIHGLNVSTNDPDFFLAPELVATYYAFDPGQHVYFTAPSPGAANGAGSLTIGPLISGVAHAPNVPGVAQALVVTARLSPTLQPVGTVTLKYRVMFGSESSVLMHDDGQHDDGAPGDGLFGGALPAGLAAPGQMIRYYIVASDTQGNAMRSPPFPDPLNSPEYDGTIVDDPSLLASSLPVLHWFTDNPASAGTDAGARSALFFNGEFFDNANANVHGQSTRGFPKLSYDISLAKGHKMLWSPDAPRISDINLLTTWADKAHARNILGYETYRDGGAPAHFAFIARVQQNGAFFSVANFVENGDEEFLERLGLDPNGALYKMYNSATSAAGNEKKTRPWEDFSDLQALINGLSQSDANARQAFMYDNLDVPEAIDFLAAKTLTADTDCCHKNHYLYRDSDGTREWQVFPWDVDLCFGRVWTCNNPCLAYYDELIYTNQPLFIGYGNTVLTPLFDTPATRQMYLRRLRTLMDTLLQPPGTPSASDFYRQKILWLRDLAGPEAALDLARWGTWGNYETITNAVDRILTEFLPGRRLYLFRTLSVTNGGEIPLAQPASPTVGFGALEYRPASGNPQQEWLSLTNPNNYAVDISGWRLEGGARFTFKGGTVLPAYSTLYVSPDVRQFRARTVSPKGSERRLVVGPYRGNLSAWGETLTLSDAANRLVSVTRYTGSPSPAQQFLRITEIMYNPPPLAGNTNDAQQFEYLELRNVSSSVTLDLGGARLTNGVHFNFTGSAITSLAPGGRLLLVKNTNAFIARYGSGLPIAGIFDGALDSNGETLRLEDSSGEKILEFGYDNKWYPVTDGLGFSLVIVDENAPWDTWGDKTSWRPSGAPGGSPGLVDPAPPVLAPVLVNEALTASDAPQVDAIELYNPNASPVNVGGWFLSDDWTTPKKYRIPADTLIPAGGFLVFTETNFNAAPGVPPSFALSSSGDELGLFSADGSSNLTGYFHGFNFGAAERGVALGRYRNSQGEEDFVAQSTNTLGSPNAYPKVGPLVVSEIMYHPPDLGTTNNTRDEFLELQNISAGALPLFDPAHHTNTWRLRNAVDFDFPTNVSLPSGGRLLVVGFDPAEAATLAAFRAVYGLGTNPAILGPWKGHLDNGSGTLELKKPDAPVATNLPYVMVEKIAYHDLPPWPLTADGQGASLQRFSLVGYGNDPTNWFTAQPTPGYPNIPNLAPAVTLDYPADDTVFQGPIDVPIYLSATDADGVLTQIELFADGIKLAEAAASPFLYFWTNAPTGPHLLQALAHDDRLGVTVSRPVSFTILSQPPVVAITNPPGAAVYLAGTAVTVGATASDPDGTVTLVQLLTNNSLLAQFAAPPYSVAWSNAPTGTHALTALALDNAGRWATSAPVHVAFASGYNSNTTLIARKSTWKFLDDGSNQGTGWVGLSFNDFAWSNGPAVLGYGNRAGCGAAHDAAGAPLRQRHAARPGAFGALVTTGPRGCAVRP